MVSVKPFKSKNRDKIYLDAPNPNLKKVLIEIFSDSLSNELFCGFHPINTHNGSLIRPSLENLYYNLFSDLDLEPPNRFYRDVSI